MRGMSLRGRPASHAERLRTEVGGETTHEGAVQMCEAEDPSAPHTGSSLQEIHAPTTFITVGGQIRITKEAELSHRLTRFTGVGACSVWRAPEV